MQREAILSMRDREAIWWMVIGIVLLVAGFELLRLDAPMLASMWGVGLLIIGGVLGVVGLGVVLRIWR
jgi:hypothetical protein